MYGASHVIFSKNEEKRQKEMSDLVKMTAQTEKNRYGNRDIDLNGIREEFGMNV